MFAYKKQVMAQALAIVGEAGIHGMKYNGLRSLVEAYGTRQSKKMRWSANSAHSFSGAEFEEYLILAWRFGFVERSAYKEVDWVAGLNKSSYEIEDEIVRLTKAGWDFVELNDQPLLHRWGANIRDNIPAIVTAILTALAINWAIKYFGA